MNNLKLSFTILHRMMHNSIITFIAILVTIGITIVSVLPAPNRDRIDVENVSLENCSVVELLSGDETTKIYKVKCLTKE